MIKKHKPMDLYCVRAFSSEKFFGNPAAVSIVEEFPENAQEIASKMNFSETVFVKPYKKNMFFIRWFSPKDEAPLCIHATIAAAYMLNKKYGLSDMTLIHKRGTIRATLDANDQVHVFLPAIPLQKLEKYPLSLPSVKEAFTDNTVDIFVLEHEKDVLNYRPDFEAIKNINKRAVCITAQSKDHDYTCRYFAPSIGIPEDPFCGSISCRLAPYWSSILQKKHLNSYQSKGYSEFIIHTDNTIEFIARADLYEERKLKTA